MKDDDKQQQQKNDKEKKAETETGTGSCSRAQTEQPTHNQVIPIDWKNWQSSNRPVKFVIELPPSGTTLRAGIAEV